MNITKAEILKDLKKMGACADGIDFVKSCKSVQEIIDKAPGHYWAFVLKKTDKYDRYCDWSKIVDWEAADVLIHRPELIKKVNLRGLSSQELAFLADRKPEFESLIPFETFKPLTIQLLLRRRPRYVTKVNLEVLSGVNWVLILEKQPQLASFCNWKKVNVFDFYNLLKTHPKMIGYLDHTNLSQTEKELILKEYAEEV